MRDNVGSLLTEDKNIRVTHRSVCDSSSVTDLDNTHGDLLDAAEGGWDADNDTVEIIVSLMRVVIINMMVSVMVMSVIKGLIMAAGI